MSFVTGYRNPALKATAQLVKGYTCAVYGWKVQNLDNVDAYLQLYDAADAADVTVGTTTPTFSIWLPGSGGDDLILPVPLRFGSGLVVAATTTIGGAVAPTNGELVNLFFA